MTDNQSKNPTIVKKLKITLNFSVTYFLKTLTISTSTLLIIMGIAACHSRLETIPHTIRSSEEKSATQHNYDLARISPDGTQLAYIDNSHNGHNLVIKQLSENSSRTISLPQGDTVDVTALDWSHANNNLVIVLHEDKKSLLYKLSTQATALSHPLIDFTGIISSAIYSPDDSHIGVLAVQNPHKQIGATFPGAPQIGLIDSSSVDEQRIGIISVAEPNIGIRFISAPDSFAYTLTWTANSQGIIATMAEGDGDAHWWNATLRYVNILNGNTRIITHFPYQIQYPVISPNSHTIAFIGGLMSDRESPGGDIYIVPFTGGTPQNITPHSSETYTYLQWKKSGLYANSVENVNQKLSKISLTENTTHTQLLWDAGAATDQQILVDDEGNKLVYIRYDFTTAPAIYAGQVTSPTKITHDNDHLLAQVQAKEISWNNEGLHLDGWLLYPQNLTPGKHPMVIHVHGGPAAFQQPEYIDLNNPPADDLTLLNIKLLEQGYFVFLPNPRGSYGHGEAFTQSNKGDFGGGDFRDILTGITAVEKNYPVDENKLIIKGRSYAGFMSMWAATTSHRFKAIIAEAGTSDWISYFGDNGIHDWMTYYFGSSPYENPQSYLHQSPIAYAKNAHTPTLIFVGERDIECPPSQSLEFFRALEYYHVPTQLYIYPNEGHHLRKEIDIIDAVNRSLQWINTYVS